MAEKKRLRAVRSSAEPAGRDNVAGRSGMHGEDGNVPYGAGLCFSVDRPHGHRPTPWLFLFGTLAWTWAFWWPAAATGQRWLEFPTVVLSALGFLGPLAVALLLVGSGRWDGTLREFLRRSFDPRLLRLRWHVVVLTLLLILHALPMLIGILLLDVDAAAISFTAPTAFLLVGLVAGAVEEPGWRGYAQDALQRRIPVLAATLMIGIFWAAWHLPLFFLEGSYQNTLGFGTMRFWLFNFAILVASPIYAWLYNAAGGLAVAAVLFHGLGNVFAEVLAVEGLAGVEVVVEAIVATAVVIGARHRMTKPRSVHG